MESLGILHLWAATGAWFQAETCETLVHTRWEALSVAAHSHADYRHRGNETHIGVKGDQHTVIKPSIQQKPPF